MCSVFPVPFVLTGKPIAVNHNPLPTWFVHDHHKTALEWLHTEKGERTRESECVRKEKGETEEKRNNESV